MLTAVCGIVSLASNTAGASEPLTLDQAIQIALEHNRRIHIAALEVEKAETRLESTRINLLPRVDFYVDESYLFTDLSFEFERGVFGTLPSTGPIPPFDVEITTPRRFTTILGATMRQPLSQISRIKNAVRVAELGREISREQLRGERAARVNDVSRAYFSVLEKQSGLRAASESLGFNRELQRTVEDHVATGLALKADGLRVRAQLAKIEHDELTLRHALSTATEQLNLLLGRDVQRELTVVELPGPSTLEGDLAASRERALAQRSEIREARLKLEQAELDQRIKRSEYKPEISLAADYISTINIEVLPSDVLRAGFYISWQPAMWGRKRHELDEKSRTVSQAQHGLRELEASILVEVGQRFRELEAARSLVSVAEFGREAAREELRNVMDRYAEQKALLSATLEAQARMADADHQFQRALLGFWTARADLTRAVGEELR